MKDKNLWLVLLAIVCSLIMAMIAIVEVVSATDANDTADWLTIEPEEKKCVDFEDDWLWISGCNPCEQYAKEDNETLYNMTDEDEYDEFKSRDWEDPGNALHIDYFMRQPKAAVTVIAFVSASMNKDLVKDVFVYKNVSFGLDTKAEKYYQAILMVHNETGFSRSEYPPCGLTLEQAKEIFYIDTDKEARDWLGEQYNWEIGRLYYYILLGTYHSWLHPEDAGSAIAVMKDAERNTSESIIEIDRVAYQLATIAYFHNRTIVDQCILYNEDLPTDEIKQVEIILEKANEPLPIPEPTPRYKYDYWENK